MNIESEWPETQEDNKGSCLAAKEKWVIYKYAHELFETVGDQNMPVENMPLWHKDYFELKTTEKQKTPKIALHPPPLYS